MPDGSFKPIPCKTRRASVCRPCAHTYKRDWQEIFYDGMFSKSGELVSDYDFHWLTFTAPSFGKVHRSSNCPCGENHSKNSSLLGVSLYETDRLNGLVPQDCHSYDYQGLISWQLNQSKLWHTLKERLRYAFGDNFAWTCAREFQNRLTVHYHIILRLPSGEYSKEYVSGVLRSLHQTRTRDNNYGFGSQWDWQPITPGNHRKYARYSAKVLNYSAKSLVQDKAEDATVVLHPARVAYETRLRVIASKTTCLKRATCDKSCKAKAHKDFGYAGHPATVSRNWALSGINRTVLKQRRRDYVLKNGSESATITYEGLLTMARYEDAKNNDKFSSSRSINQVEKSLANLFWNNNPTDEEIDLIAFSP